MIVDRFIFKDTILKNIFNIKEKDYCGQIIWKIEYDWRHIWKIAEFSKMEKCNQNPKWHGEGNCKKHTINVCEAALKLCDMLYYKPIKDNKWIVSEEDFDNVILLLTSALFHDIGKINVTTFGKDEKWHSYNHEFEGEKITRRLLWDTGYEFREKVCSLVKYHMMPLSILNRKDYIEEIMRINLSIPSWDLLINLKKCDLDGSIQEDEKLKEADYLKLTEVKYITTCINQIYYPSRKHSYEKYLDSINKKPINLIVMIGLPGSGKDTYINSYYKSDKYAIISRDTIRIELGFCKENEKIVGTTEQEAKVTEMFNKSVLTAAEEGKDIVINNINLKKKYRDNYTQLLSDYDLNITYVYIEANCLNKNIERRKGQISKEVFYNMIENFEWPIKSEYDKMIVAKS